MQSNEKHRAHMEYIKKEHPHFSVDLRMDPAIHSDVVAKIESLPSKELSRKYLYKIRTIKITGKIKKTDQGVARIHLSVTGKLTRGFLKNIFRQEVMKGFSNISYDAMPIPEPKTIESKS